MSDYSSDEDFIPVGFDPQEFRKKRESKIGSRKTIMSHQKTEDESKGVPQELKYEVLLKKAMVELSRNDKSYNDSTSKMKLPLEVKRESSSKTSINIMEIAQLLERDYDHIMKFILNELLTTGSINKEGKLIMKGIFLKNQIQEILRMYIEHFVVCKSCDTVENTVIQKENKLYFLKCGNCGGTRCVGNIVEGFKAKGKVRPKLRGLI